MSVPKFGSDSTAFAIELHGEVTLIRVAPALESLDPGHVEAASTLVLDALRDQSSPQVIFDLSGLTFVGSAFLAVMIRCWKQVSSKGGTMILSGIGPSVRQLLGMTALDRVWPIYGTSIEAIEALAGD